MSHDNATREEITLFYFLVTNDYVHDHKTVLSLYCTKTVFFGETVLHQTNRLFSQKRDQNFENYFVYLLRVHLTLQRTMDITMWPPTLCVRSIHVTAKIVPSNCVDIFGNPSQSDRTIVHSMSHGKIGVSSNPTSRRKRLITIIIDERLKTCIMSQTCRQNSPRYLFDVKEICHRSYTAWCQYGRSA